MICYVLGRILLVEAALLALPLLVALAYGEPTGPFLVPMLTMILCGFLLGQVSPRTQSLYARDGLAIAAMAWILLSLFGAVPFYYSGAIPSLIDSFFESVSGFTTTGASILKDAELLSRGMLFWRSFTHWVGGMGVLVFVMAILPTTDGHDIHLLRAEFSGPAVGKLSSRLGDTTKILYGIYLALTAAEFVLLLLGGMPAFDACVTTFGTAGTGGFNFRNLSIGAYNNPYFDAVIGIFMLLFGVNFNIYFLLFMGKVREALRSEELRVYLAIAAAATLTVAWNISHLFSSFATALRYAFFQVSAIISTTGYTTADFSLWPTYSKVVLVLLMFCGGCAGSTSCGIKLSRLVLLAKSAVSDMRQMLHPSAVATVRMDGRPVSDKTVRGTHVFFAAYLLLLGLSTLLLSLDGFDLTTTFSAALSCVSNIGPVLGMVGPMGNFSEFSPMSKLLLCFDMLAGRLELFPMLLLGPSLWHGHRRSLLR